MCAGDYFFGPARRFPDRLLIGMCFGHCSCTTVTTDGYNFMQTCPFEQREFHALLYLSGRHLTLPPNHVLACNIATVLERNRCQPLFVPLCAVAPLRSLVYSGVFGGAAPDGCLFEVDLHAVRSVSIIRGF